MSAESTYSAVFSELVARVGKMSREEVQLAIDASHPVEQIADIGNEATQRCLDADALAMELIHGRLEKRDIVNMLRWALMGCPSQNA